MVESRSIGTGQRFRDTLSELGVSYRRSIDVRSRLVECRFCHQASFDKENESRCTEYQSNCADDHSTGLRRT
jgi:hypothetical protein